MGMAFYTQIPCTIPSGAAVSSWIIAGQIHDAAAIVIYSPATLDALTFTIEVEPVGDGTGTARTLVDETGTNIGPPAAAKARWYAELASVGSFRIKASGNVAADRAFVIGKQWTL